MRSHSIARALFAIAILAGSPAAAQVVRAGTPVTGRPPMRVIPVAPTPRPDVPLLIGLNTGHAIRIDNMAGAAVQELASDFRATNTTTTAPRLGLGPQGRLIALVPGGVPQTRVLLPTPGWQMLDGRLHNAIDFDMDATGLVMYGVLSSTKQVFRYDMASRELRLVGGPGTGPGQLTFPEHTAIDPMGRIYVADGNRIVRMNDITGNGWTAFGSHGGGRGQFNSITGLAVDSKGRIYASDYFNNRIVKIDDITGAGWAEYRTGISYPRGVATDMYDRLYVALPRADRVLRMDDITGAGLKLFDLGRVPGFTRPMHAGPATIVPLRPGRRDDVPR
ncbi:MAG TPA: NHL repeat-containing protein [Longimicrobium sp.]|jgi:DNA-binding beta-propeller fold protein YncE